MERRRSRRYSISLRVEVTQIAGKRVARQETTSNISSGGIRFDSARDFEKGGKMEFLVTLDPREPSVRLRCVGRVLRVQRNDRCYQVAATIERYRFLRGAEPQPQVH